jgi:predicted ATP-dependent protease
VAAIRAGVKEVILPKLNEKDLKELPESVRHGVKFRLVETMDEVLQIAMNPPPVVAPEIAASDLVAGAVSESPEDPGDEQVPLAH